MHEEFLRQAVELSRRKMALLEGGPFAALVVLDGVVVGEGWNRVTGTNDPTAHAEVNAIRDACSRLNTYSLEGAVIYSSCEPCPMCLSAIYWARVSAIYYANTTRDAAAIGFDDAFLYDEIALEPEARSLRCTHLAIPGAAEVFSEWAGMPDKTPY